MIHLPKFNSILNKHFLNSKVTTLNPNTPVVVSAADSIKSVLEKLAQTKIGSVLVTENNAVCGIFTERDVLVKVALSGIALDAPVKKVMTPSPVGVKSNASIARALHAMAVGRYRHLLIEYKDDRLGKIISVKDIADFIHERFTKKLANAPAEEKEIATTVDGFFSAPIEILKPYQPISVEPAESLRKTLKLLCERNIGGVVIIGAAGSPSGIFTERDYLLKIAGGKFDLDVTPISQVMTAKPSTLLENASVAMAFNAMSEGGYRHIPIVDHSEKLVGVLTVRNFIEFLAQGILKELGG